MRAVHVLVLLTDVDAPYPRPIIVNEVRFLRQIDEFVRIGLEQPPRITGRLAVGETIVLDFAKLLLLTPALLIGGFVWRCQPAVPNLSLVTRSRRRTQPTHIHL